MFKADLYSGDNIEEVFSRGSTAGISWVDVVDSHLLVSLSGIDKLYALDLTSSNSSFVVMTTTSPHGVAKIEAEHSCAPTAAPTA